MAFDKPNFPIDFGITCCFCRHRFLRLLVVKIPEEIVLTPSLKFTSGGYYLCQGCLITAMRGIVSEKDNAKKELRIGIAVMKKYLQHYPPPNLTEEEKAFVQSIDFADISDSLALFAPLVSE